MKIRAGDYERDRETGLLVPRSRQRGLARVDPQLQVGPGFFGGAASATGRLDALTTNLWSCGGLDLIRGNWAGAAIRVRRSSDNTEQDIGFIATALDTVSMVAFCGVGDGFIVKAYDQSGGGNDFGQTTQAAQPKIVSSGAALTDIQWDGSNDYLVRDRKSVV